MKKKTVKLTNFVKIKEDLNALAEQYKIAKENDNAEELNKINAKYEDLKVLLRSNSYYFNNLNEYEINNQIANETDEKQIGYLEAKKAEKKVYKSNKSYIAMVEKADTIDDYIVKNSQKKRNFVKKHFKPIVVGAAALMLLGSLSACRIGNRKNKAIYETNDKVIETTTEETKQDDKEEITTEKLNDLVETNDNGITLNPLETSTDENGKNNENTKKDDVSYTNKGNGSVGTTGNTSTGTGKTTTTEKSLDPHTSTKEAGTKKTTTTTETIKEESVKEPDAVDYPTTIIDNTGKKSTETTDYEYKEETVDINDGTDMPIDEPTTEKEKTTEEETIIIEENEEYEDTYNGDFIDESSSLVLTYRMI